jgi:dienelactone hydrolase
MSSLKQIGLCAVAAVWLGCNDPMEEATTTETWESMTPGGQTPVPLPNPSGRGYYEYLPAGYGTGTRFPLIVFFHGAGERGNGSLAELPRVLKHGPPKLIENGKAFPAIVISPQTATNWLPSITTPFVNYLLANYDVDPDRVYITGLSLGGEGTWRHALANPGIPAAIVPICGPDNSTGYGVLSQIPTWVFHRAGDTVVRISESQDILVEVTGVRPDVTGNEGKTGYFNGSAWGWRAGQAAPATGENPTFTVYTGTSHDAWTAAYNNQAMWDWLFAQRRPTPPGSNLVFQQDFQSSTSVSSYANSTHPTIGQFNDIGGQVNSGTFSINGGRLRLARTGDGTDNDAAIMRWTDLAGPPAVLHVAFDVGVSGWTLSPYQSGALVLNVGHFTGLVPYDSGGVAAGIFHSIAVKGEGIGQFTIMTSGIKSSLLAANGTLHHVDLFLNKSGAAASYRAPDGSLRSLQNNGVALWVNGAAVVVSGAASNGSSSTLTDFRLRWPGADNGTWLLDNFVIKRAFPQ